MAAEHSTRTIEEVGDLDTTFLQTILKSAPISSFNTTRIGTGQVGEVYRIYLTYSSDPTSATPGPATAILKIASKDPRSRSSGLSLGIYERENRFYGEIVPSITANEPKYSTQCIPQCYYSVFDPSTGALTLILQDAGPDVEVGDEFKGASFQQAQVALRELGHLHAALLMDPGQREWLIQEDPLTGAYLRQLFAGFKFRYKDRVEPEHMEICDRFVASFDAYMEAVKEPGACNMGVIHGDYRMDNMLFSGPQGVGPLNLTVVDWQMIRVGPLLMDVAYFLGGSLKIEDRRQWTDSLLQIYCNGLAEVAGETVLSLEDAKRDLKLLAFGNHIMAIASSMLVVHTKRGDDMFMTMLARACEQVKDLRSMGLLPRPKASNTPLRPNPEDEQTHLPGPERDWNESWYFDFVDEARGLAGWVRLGVTPNKRGNWYLMALTRGGQPTVIVSDFRAPAPDASLRLKTDNIEATHEVQEPLRKFRITLKASGQAYEKAADSLQMKQGLPTEVELDLLYETDGIPYKYRLTTRYEMPCKVTGTVKVDDRSPLGITAVPGQRDHSYGVRDWWGMDWVWSAIHLEGGQRLHATELRLFHAPSMSMGYVQQHDSVWEIATVLSQEKLDDDGLVDESNMTISAHDFKEDISIHVSPMDHTPLKFLSEDGRSSSFDRAWVKVRLADGRNGVGWFEWNRNER